MFDHVCSKSKCQTQNTRQQQRRIRINFTHSSNFFECKNNFISHRIHILIDQAFSNYTFHEMTTFFWVESSGWWIISDMIQSISFETSNINFLNQKEKAIFLYFSLFSLFLLLLFTFCYSREEVHSHSESQHTHMRPDWLTAVWKVAASEKRGRQGKVSAFLQELKAVKYKGP